MAQPGEWTTDRCAAALSGPDSRLLRRMSVGVALIGGDEEPPGSCVLLVDTPLVRRLTDLPRERRLGFLGDLDLLAEAVHHVCTRREGRLVAVDLRITSVSDRLQAHVCPRYADPGPTRAQHDLRTELVRELDLVSAASRADYPARHVYGSRAARRSV